jgi:hypothetical protein
MMTRKEIEDDVIENFELPDDIVPPTKKARAKLEDFLSHFDPVNWMVEKDQGVIPDEEWADFVATVRQRFAAEYEGLTVLWFVKKELYSMKRMLEAVINSDKLEAHHKTAERILEQIAESESSE